MLVLLTKLSSNFLDFNPYFTCLQTLPASLIGDFGRALAPKLSKSSGTGVWRAQGAGFVHFPLRVRGLYNDRVDIGSRLDVVMLTI